MKVKSNLKILHSEAGLFLSKFFIVFALITTIIFSILVIVTPFAELLVAMVAGYILSAIILGDRRIKD